jgi:hypothetical protein
VPSTAKSPKRGGASRPTTMLGPVDRGGAKR